MPDSRRHYRCLDQESNPHPKSAGRPLPSHGPAGHVTLRCQRSVLTSLSPMCASTYYVRALRCDSIAAFILPRSWYGPVCASMQCTVLASTSLLTGLKVHGMSRQGSTFRFRIRLKCPFRRLGNSPQTSSHPVVY